MIILNNNIYVSIPHNTALRMFKENVMDVYVLFGKDAELVESQDEILQARMDSRSVGIWVGDMEGIEREQMNDVSTNEGLVRHYMNFGSPMNQMFLMQAIINQSTSVWKTREELMQQELDQLAEGKRPFVSMQAWVDSAKAFIDLHDANRDYKLIKDGDDK